MFNVRKRYIKNHTKIVPCPFFFCFLPVASFMSLAGRSCNYGHCALRHTHTHAQTLTRHMHRYTLRTFIILILFSFFHSFMCAVIECKNNGMDIGGAPPNGIGHLIACHLMQWPFFEINKTR